ncbi:MAG: universal stress protein [Balneolaceae bacterium]|nr:universal stress protein [Balneolaceae bacterium]
MINRILVALDLDIDTPLAMRYGIKLAKKFKASVSGLAVVDTADIATQVGGGAIGTIYYAEELRKYMAEDSTREAAELLKKFEKMADEAGVKHSQLMEEGVPYERIIEDLKYHDLLVIGRESHFFFNRPEKDTDTLADIVKKSTAPTLVVNEAYREIDRVLIAHDGSSASARSLQWFIQLEPFGKNIEMEVVHVCDMDDETTVDKSRLLMHLVSDYLKAHSYSSINEKLLDEGNTGEVIIKHVKETGADLVVMGAHSMSAIRRLTFGSTTHKLVKESPVPLFLSN